MGGTRLAGIRVEKEFVCGCVVGFRGGAKCAEAERLEAAARDALEGARRTGDWATYERTRAEYARHRDGRSAERPDEGAGEDTRRVLYRCPSAACEDEWLADEETDGERWYVGDGRDEVCAECGHVGERA